ncbi:hypothetical protein [Cyclobacterium marinum]|nr:hypothetical protein [Cyclobacterium marinum]
MAKNTTLLLDLDLEKLSIKKEDKATIKLWMLIEGTYYTRK